MLHSSIRLCHGADRQGLAGVNARRVAVKTWNAYRDRETGEVHVSVSDDGTVFVLETAIWREM